MESGPDKEKSLLELLAELVELVNEFVRQQIGATVDKGIVRPIKTAGLWAALTMLAAVVTALAVIFIVVGLFLLLIRLVGAAWIAFLVVGSLLALGAFLLILIRRRQKNAG